MGQIYVNSTPGGQPVCWKYFIQISEIWGKLEKVERWVFVENSWILYLAENNKVCVRDRFVSIVRRGGNQCAGNISFRFQKFGKSRKSGKSGNLL
jgi:hypothetical protein